MLRVFRARYGWVDIMQSPVSRAPEQGETTDKQAPGDVDKGRRGGIKKREGCGGDHQKCCLPWTRLLWFALVRWSVRCPLRLLWVTSAVRSSHTTRRNLTSNQHTYEMTTRRIIGQDGEEKTYLDVDPRGPPGPSNISPAVPA